LHGPRRKNGAHNLDEGGDCGSQKIIAAYFGQYNLRSAVKAGDRIRERVNLLQELPFLGHAGRIAGTRQFAVPQRKCVVIYRIERETVKILRVMHGGQEWPKEL
jgi:toxin ParE1/3/4